MSGEGKSTIANALKERFQAERCMMIVLDRDARMGLNAGFGFSYEDRLENVRRTTAVAALFKAQGFLVICSLISLLIIHRKLAREIIGERFFEVHSNSLACCEACDPKGLYVRARRGEDSRDYGRVVGIRNAGVAESDDRHSRCGHRDLGQHARGVRAQSHPIRAFATLTPPTARHGARMQVQTCRDKAAAKRLMCKLLGVTDKPEAVNA